jgi:hypothetical protein
MLRKLIIIASLLTIAAAAQGQTLDFTLSTSTPDGLTVVPKLTWNTVPAATICTASGGVGWAGSKAASGTQTLAAVSATQAYGIVCSWPGAVKAAVTWTAPTTNVDGSAYTDPGGFRIQYGTSATNLATSVYLQDPAARSWTSPNLTAGTWYFAVRAYNSMGLEGPLSNVASKTMTADASKSAGLTLAITIPGAPILSLQ